METGNRQTGRTTNLMRTAPSGAYYVWPAYTSLAYAKALAGYLGRDDLQFVLPIMVIQRRLRGTNKQIVVDHAVDITSNPRDRDFFWQEITILNSIKEGCVNG